MGLNQRNPSHAPACAAGSLLVSSSTYDHRLHIPSNYAWNLAALRDNISIKVVYDSPRPGLSLRVIVSVCNDRSCLKKRCYGLRLGPT